MIRNWFLTMIVKFILKKLEPWAQDMVATLFKDMLGLIDGSTTPGQMVQDLKQHFEAFKKANA